MTSRPLSAARPSSARWLGTIGVVGVLALAALLRFWALGRPGSLVFDELFYVRDAITQLAHGFPTTWPDDDARMGKPFTDNPSFAVHPPLGKWLIGLGILVFGDGSGWGWRSAVAFFGVATVAVTMRLGWWISRSLAVSLLAGLALAIDGVHVVLTRVAILDGFLAFFVALGALLMWRDHEWVVRRTAAPARPPRDPVLWNRPWLFAAAAVFGWAAAVKWSGLYPLAAFLVVTALRDLVVRLRTARAAHSPSASRTAARLRARYAWIGAVSQAAVTALIALPTALAAYVASWTGWIVTSGGWGRTDKAWWPELWKYHVDMFEWHSTLSAPHPFLAHPLTWPLALRPTKMYLARDDGIVSIITPIPNPLITLSGVLALTVLLWWAIRPLLPPRAPGRGLARGRTTFAAVFVLAGYLSGWLPWLLTVTRPAVFQFYAVVLTPFSALALALVLGAAWGSARRLAFTGPRFSAVDPDDLLGRHLAVGLFVGFALVLAALFFPVWAGVPIAEWFWRWHIWLPGWS